MLIGEDYNKITIDVLGIEWMEPMAIFTNLLMCGVSLFAFFKLQKTKSTHGLFGLWKSFFLLYFLAGFTSAFSHGLYGYIGFFGKIPAWGFGVISIMLLEIIMLKTYAPSNKTFLRLSVLKAIGVLTLAFSLQNFLPVAINAVFGLLLIVAPIAIMNTRTNQGFTRIWQGVSLLVPAAILYLGKINPHLWMNKDDVSHILMAFTILLFYSGAKRILATRIIPVGEEIEESITSKPLI